MFGPSDGWDLLTPEQQASMLDETFGDSPLPPPGRTEDGRSHCNAPLVVQGREVAYCARLVRPWDRGFWRWKIPAGTHRGPHYVEWREADD